MKPSASFSIKKRSPSSSSLLVTTVIPVALLILLSSFLFSNSSHHPHSSNTPPVTTRPPPPPEQPSFIKTICTNTPYPSLCFDTLSSTLINPHQDVHTRTRNFLRFAIQKTISRVDKSRSRIAALTLKVQEVNSVKNCLRLLDLTQLELQEAMKYVSPSYTDLQLPYASIKSLLSAAMSNDKTCIDGFSDSKLDDNTQPRLTRYFQKSLTPIKRMISNCLEITKYLDTIDSFKNTRLLSKGIRRDHVPSWMTTADTRLVPCSMEMGSMNSSFNTTLSAHYTKEVKRLYCYFIH